MLEKLEETLKEKKIQYRKNVSYLDLLPEEKRLQKQLDFINQSYHELTDIEPDMDVDDLRLEFTEEERKQVMHCLCSQLRDKFGCWVSKLNN